MKHSYIFIRSLYISPESKDCLRSNWSKAFASCRSTIWCRNLFWS